MPLVHLLFDCPICGHGPLHEAAEDEATCPSCGTGYRRGGPGARIEVQEPGREAREVPAWELARVLEGGGAGAEDISAEGKGTLRSTRVTVRRLASEEPVEFRGSLLGFAERSTPEESGTLTLTSEALIYRADGAPEPEEWALLGIRAVQTSSRAVQVRVPGGGLVELRFPEDSPRRWDELLRSVITGLWRRSGRGEITEFQPRITTR